MGYAVFDIETREQDKVKDSLIKYFRERLWSSKNDPEKAEEQDRFLNPLLSQMYCFCIKTEDDTIVGADMDEKEVLTKFWNAMGNVFEYGKPQLVTFNGMNFDIPYVMARTAINGINHFELPNRRWSFAGHFDVRMYLTNWSNYQAGSLEAWASAFGIDFDEELGDSTNYKEWWEKKEYETIQKHNIQDVLLIEKLYLKIRDLRG